VGGNGAKNVVRAGTNEVNKLTWQGTDYRRPREGGNLTIQECLWYSCYLLPGRGKGEKGEGGGGESSKNVWFVWGGGKSYLVEREKRGQLAYPVRRKEGRWDVLAQALFKKFPKAQRGNAKSNRDRNSRPRYPTQ